MFPKVGHSSSISRCICGRRRGSVRANPVHVIDIRIKAQTNLLSKPKLVPEGATWAHLLHPLIIECNAEGGDVTLEGL